MARRKYSKRSFGKVDFSKDRTKTSQADRAEEERYTFSFFLAFVFFHRLGIDEPVYFIEYTFKLLLETIR